MIPLVIIIVAGLSGLEGLLWGDKAAKEKGYEKGSNYQKQSAIAMLAVCLSLLFHWFCYQSCSRCDKEQKFQMAECKQTIYYGFSEPLFSLSSDSLFCSLINNELYLFLKL